MFIKTHLELDLSPNEELKKHQQANRLFGLLLPLILWSGIILVLELLVLAIWLFPFIQNENALWQVGIQGGIALGGFLLAMSLWLSWAGEWHVITGQRLIRSHFSYSLLGPDPEYLSLSQIIQVDPRQNFFTRMFNTGHLTIRTAANKEFVLHYVKGLRSFERELTDLRNAFSESQSETNDVLQETMERMIEALDEHTMALRENTAALKANQKPSAPPPQAWQI